MVRRPVQRFFSERDRGSGRARAPAVSVFLLVVSALAFQAPAQSPEDPALVGQWSPVIDWPAVSVHTHLLPTGDVLFWAYDDSDGFYRWDPATEAVTVAADPVRNVFCSGHSFLPDGSLLVSGGHVRDDIGLRSASIYDPFLDSWTNIPDTNAGRWYPSSTTPTRRLTSSEVPDPWSATHPRASLWERRFSWRRLTRHSSPTSTGFGSAP